MARPRLTIAGALGLLTFFLIPHEWVNPTGSRLLLGWNAGAVCYLVLAALMMTRSGPDQMRRRALHQDEGRWMILGLVIAAAVAVVFAHRFSTRDGQGSAGGGSHRSRRFGCPHDDLLLAFHPTHVCAPLRT